MRSESESVIDGRLTTQQRDGADRRLVLPEPYLLFLGDTCSVADLKTAFGLRDWAPEKCVGQYRMSEHTMSIGLADLGFGAARAAGAKSLLIGVASAGGAIPKSWWPHLCSAAQAGLSIISGMHDPLRCVPNLSEIAAESGGSLVDIRHWQPGHSVGTGIRRQGRRLLTVGTDCAIGKKYTALAISKAMSLAGMKATFRATGQTGIMLAGAGVPIDSVISDFVSGAAERLSPDNVSEHWDIIEGQGTLFHPAYAAVSLGLLHGSQPDLIVLCHDHRRKEIDGFPGFLVPTPLEAIDLNLSLARLTNSQVRCAGISLNTSGLDDESRRSLFRSLEDDLGYPCFDPMVTGVGKVLEQLA
jgi:uncharacterized NAD-dependent epimerase/dehydratase family protein